MTPEETNDSQPDPTIPDYERIAAELMQQWQQQFLQPVLKPELTEAMGKGGTVAQSLLEMGQVLWQGWLQGHAVAPNETAAPAAQSAYAGADVHAAPVSEPSDRHAATAAAPLHGNPGAAGGASNGEPAVQPDAPFAASMASVALCAELARRLDLLSQRVARLESQLEQQRAGKQ